MALFDKKMRFIANTIKDDFIKKYVLEYFLAKISDLTPHTNHKKKFNYPKKIKSLDATKKYYEESQSLTGVELKEFSLLYLIMNNLELMRDNIHIVENIKLFTRINKSIFEKIIARLKLNEHFEFEDLGIDNQLIEKINKFASIKNILQNKKKSNGELIGLLEDIGRDLNNYDLEFRIQELESKFSKDFSEATFNELK